MTPLALPLRHPKKRVIRVGSKRKAKPTRREETLTRDVKARVALIPIGLEAVGEELEREVEQLAGPKHLHSTWRKKLQRAYEKPTYEEAKAALIRLKPELKLLNVSAVSRLEERLDSRPLAHLCSGASNLK